MFIVWWARPTDPALEVHAAPRTEQRSELGNVMGVHRFAIVATGYNQASDITEEIISDLGCCDAVVVSWRMGALVLSYNREAKSLSSAILSAFHEVSKAGFRVTRIEPDHLVTLADIAKRSGLSRAALTAYHKGRRQFVFPAPVARVTSENPLWDWFEVATFLNSRGQVTIEIVEQAQAIRAANMVVETKALGLWVEQPERQ